jgi:peptidoglycan hydrolase-like protein with peptidoglycan-binding domain
VCAPGTRGDDDADADADAGGGDATNVNMMPRVYMSGVETRESLTTYLVVIGRLITDFEFLDQSVATACARIRMASASPASSRGAAPRVVARRRRRRRSLARGRTTTTSRAVSGADDAPSIIMAPLDFNGAIRAHAQTRDCTTPMSATLVRDMALGDGGTDVALVQRLLGVRASGVYDSVTASAVSAWQRSRGAPASGYFGARAREQVAAEEELWRAAGGAELGEYLRLEVLRESSSKFATTRTRTRTESTAGSLTPFTKSAKKSSVGASSSSSLFMEHVSSRVHAIGAIGAIAIGMSGMYWVFQKRARAMTSDADASTAQSITANADVDVVSHDASESNVLLRTLNVVRDAYASSVHVGVSKMVAARDAALASKREFDDALTWWHDIFEILPDDADADATDANAESDLATIPGSFDKDGRWWESPIAPMASHALTEPKVEPSRVEHMRNRWARLRVHKSPTADERESSKRVAEFLGSKSRDTDASSSS